MLVILVLIVVAIGILSGFGVIAIHKMNPDKLRIYAESRLAKFGLEISRSGKADKPPAQNKELEAKRDGS